MANKTLNSYNLKELTNIEQINICGGDKAMKNFGLWWGATYGNISNAVEDFFTHDPGDSYMCM